MGQDSSSESRVLSHEQLVKELVRIPPTLLSLPIELLTLPFLG